MIHEEYCPWLRRTILLQSEIIDALKDKQGENSFRRMAGKNPPIEQMAAMKIEKYGIKPTTVAISCLF